MQCSFQYNSAVQGAIQSSAICRALDCVLHCAIYIAVQCAANYKYSAVQSLAPLAPNWGKIIRDRGGDNKLSDDKELNCQ